MSTKETVKAHFLQKIHDPKMSGVTVKAALSNQCYASHMREIMEELFSTRETADVTIVTDDKFEVMAHKEVLKASSGFFKNYLGSYSQPKQLVFLRGVRYLELNALLRFIYLGDTQVSSERFRHFIQVGKELEIKGIDIIEQEKARKEIQRQYETANCEMEYARVLSEGLADQEKTRMENQSQYETVNCEIEYSKVLSEGLHDQEDKAETFTEINEDDYDYYQALANKFSPDSSDTECNERISDNNHDVAVIQVQNLNKSFSEDMDEKLTFERN